MQITIFIGGLSGGGAERTVCNLANYLHEKGHEITLLTMADDVPSYPIERGIKRICLLKQNERHGLVLDSILRWWRLKCYVKRDALDCYVVMLPVTILFLLSMRPKAPVIMSERSWPQSYSGRIQRRLQKWANRAAACVCQTEVNAEWYRSVMGADKVQIIPNAINQDFIIPRYDGVRRKEIVAVGRLNEAKNYPLLIKAFSAVHVESPEYSLVIYGKGSLQSELQKLAKTLGVGEKVEFRGFTTDIKSKIQDSSIYVLSSDYEGMPNTLAEAMALGLSCIATDCDGGGARYLIDDGVNGLLVPKGDEKALAGAMRRLMKDDALREKVGKEASKLQQQLSPEVVYGRWLSLIENKVELKNEIKK